MFKSSGVHLIRGFNFGLESTETKLGYNQKLNLYVTYEDLRTVSAYITIAEQWTSTKVMRDGACPKGFRIVSVSQPEEILKAMNWKVSTFEKRLSVNFAQNRSDLSYE